MYTNEEFHDLIQTLVDQGHSIEEAYDIVCAEEELDSRLGEECELC